mmetsp:Transcript_43734/g.79830  ORF Transcript_43734/g.79830 Transcript_43734/m.79830 type:complete len:257 (-) Transcript_43734:353-1123(-)
MEAISKFLLGPSKALLLLCLQVWHHVCDKLLLMSVDGSIVMHLLCSVLAQGDRCGKELGLIQIRLYKGALRRHGLSGQALDDLACKLCTCEAHGKSSGAAAILHLHNLITTEHDAVSQCIPLLIREAHLWLCLREQGDNCCACVATHHWHLYVQDVISLCLANKCPCAANIQGGDAHQLLWVVHSILLQHLSCNGHSGVDWVGDDEDACLRASLRATLHQGLHNACVDIEEIITCHAGLPGNTCWNDDNIATIKCL